MITVCILSKNEEKNIEKCLKSVIWCDEVLVIDDNSLDRSPEIAKKLGATVIKHTLTDFSHQRNFGISRAKNDWVFFVDADEIVSKELRDEIIKKTAENTADGFIIKRTDFLWGEKLKFGEAGNIKLLRLAKKDAGAWKGIVHEVWHVEGKTEELQNTLLHYPHQSITEFLEEINKYTSLRAQELYEEKKSVSWISIIVYPGAKFFVNYFLKLGFMDGVPGIIHALLMSLHSFLVRSKLYALSHT